MGNFFIPIYVISFFVGAALYAQPGQFKVAFGSCAHQDHPLPILDTIATHKPDFFIFLGDNIYGDTENMQALKAKYKQLGDKTGFKKLNATSKILATWDDHDYGANDIGRHWKYKKESKEIFLDFFGEPADSERRKHEGIYTSYIIDAGNKKIQIVLLDTRTFRDNLRRARGRLARNLKYSYDYLPHKNKDSTLLGAEQWQWLEAELKKPADLRLICSGTQFGIEFNGYEAWANFPSEQTKMLELIKTTKANGVIFLTGDVHYGEISKINCKELYPVYDVTSSGLSSTWDFATPNRNRVKGPVMENNFGLITIDHSASDPEVKIELRDVTNKARAELKMKFSELTMK